MANPVAILAEGVADAAFLTKLLEFKHISEFFQIRKPAGIDLPNKIVCPECGKDFQPNREAAGTGGFGARLRTIKFLQDSKGITYKHIVIVVDSDQDHDAEFARVQQKIQEAGDYDVPERPYQLSKQGKYPSIAVAMLPKDQAGCLETVCLQAVNQKYASNLKCVDAAAKCVGAHKWRLVTQAKFKVQCLLSSICDKNPYTPLKHAWSYDPARGWPADIFPLKDAAFKPLADFLLELSRQT